MTGPKAILTGAVLIAAAVILSNGSEAVSHTTAGGPGTYMVAAGARGGVAYVLNTVTGSTRYCEEATSFSGGETFDPAAGTVIFVSCDNRMRAR